MAKVELKVTRIAIDVGKVGRDWTVKVEARSPGAVAGGYTWKGTYRDVVRPKDAVIWRGDSTDRSFDVRVTATERDDKTSDSDDATLVILPFGVAQTIVCTVKEEGGRNAGATARVEVEVTPSGALGVDVVVPSPIRVQRGKRSTVPLTLRPLGIPDTDAVRLQLAGTPSSGTTARLGAGTFRGSYQLEFDCAADAALGSFDLTISGNVDGRPDVPVQTARTTVNVEGDGVLRITPPSVVAKPKDRVVLVAEGDLTGVQGSLPIEVQRTPFDLVNLVPVALTAESPRTELTFDIPRGTMSGSYPIVVRATRASTTFTGTGSIEVIEGSKSRIVAPRILQVPATVTLTLDGEDADVELRHAAMDDIEVRFSGRLSKAPPVTMTVTRVKPGTIQTLLVAAANRDDVEPALISVSP